MKANDRSRASAFGSIRDELADQSGAFPIGSAHREPAVLEGLDELAPEAVSLIPEPPPASLRPKSASLRPPSDERAQLVIEDLSLRPDNPYLANSLVPPPASPTRKRNVAWIAAGMFGAAAVGALIELIVLGVHVAPAHAPPVVEVQRIVAPAGAPAPRVVAPSAEVAAVPSSPVPAAVVEAADPDVVAAPAAIPTAPAAAKVARAELPAPPEPEEVIQASQSATTTVAEAASSAALAAGAELTSPTGAPVPSVQGAVQERLTRAQVAAAFDAVRSEVERCAQGAHGIVEIDAAITSSGRVAHALIGGTFVGTPVGSCMARAVRAARFPESAQQRTNVRYPISL
jgi:hypothetical protein